MSSRGLLFLLLAVLCSMVCSKPYLVRRVPVVYKRIPYTADPYFIESPILPPVLWRARRSQPTVETEYPDEFSADPFETVGPLRRVRPGIIG